MPARPPSSSRGSAAAAVAARGLGFGGDYNPEQWPETTWHEDARLMRHAGVTFVTLGVFAWARLEPTPGERDFTWLARAMDLLHEHGILVDLATATASPPAWLLHRHPEVLPVDDRGNRLSYGSRQSWCPSSPVYREHALSLVNDLATRFRDHPALALWHVSNELGCHNAHCHCPVSAEAFRRWLRARYGDLDGLNEAWGTAFWSQHYAAWEEVLTPRATTALPNPTQLLDFRRFSSDELLSHHRAERDVLAEVCPDVPVTTNFMVSSHIDALDYWSWAPEQDVISNDHYLDGRLPDPHVELALCADWTRGLADGNPWILMEHSTGAVNWQPRNYPKRPGEMQRNTLTHVARGADTAGFFQWRASAVGAEKYHSAMLPHAGTDSRKWREVVELGRSLERLAEVAGTRVSADVAFVLDWDSRWALERPSMPSSDITYLDRVGAFYRWFWDAGITVDMRPPGAPLDGYRLVLAPCLHVVDDATRGELTRYVQAGGHLLTTYLSGIVDRDDRIHLGGYPGALRELLGVRVEEFTPLPPTARVALAAAAEPGTVVGTADEWIEDVALQGAVATHLYSDGAFAGAVAVTRRQLDRGVARYVAARTDAPATDAVLREACRDAGIEPSTLPAGVEVVRRRGDGRGFVFVVNHTEEDVEVPFTGVDLLADAGSGARAVVAAGAVGCFREEECDAVSDR